MIKKIARWLLAEVIDEIKMVALRNTANQIWDSYLRHPLADFEEQAQESVHTANEAAARSQVATAKAGEANARSAELGKMIAETQKAGENHERALLHLAESMDALRESQKLLEITVTELANEVDKCC